MKPPLHQLIDAIGKGMLAHVLLHTAEKVPFAIIKGEGVVLFVGL